MSKRACASDDTTENREKHALSWLSALLWAWRHVTPPWRHVTPPWRHAAQKWRHEAVRDTQTPPGRAAAPRAIGTAPHRHKTRPFLVTKPATQTRPALLPAKPRGGGAPAGRGLRRERAEGAPPGPGGAGGERGGRRGGREGAGRARCRSGPAPRLPSRRAALRHITFRPPTRAEARPARPQRAGRGHGRHWLAAPRSAAIGRGRRRGAGRTGGRGADWLARRRRKWRRGR